jgi:hypothetical protein
MKTRNGFVSNSSSSSFVVSGKDITFEQGKRLLDYYYSPMNTDGWSITLEGNSIVGWTPMDNGAMSDFMVEIGITSKSPVQWDHHDC